MKSTAITSDILLVGQPNVGKSVLFSRLTGIKTIASNYPGTTISYTAGEMRFAGTRYEVVDAPGTYVLEPLDEAGRVTIDLLDDAQRLVNVVDSTHLERHLPLTLELIAQKTPMVIALNMSDEAHHQGIRIDTEKLEELLDVPVIPITARTGEGIKTMISTLLSLPASKNKGDDTPGHPGHHPHIQHLSTEKPKTHHQHLNQDQVWKKIGQIIEEVQTLTHRHESFGEHLGDLSVHPVWGGFFALFVLALSFSLIRLIGEFLIGGGIGIVGEPWLVLPFGTELLFEKWITPLLMKLSYILGEKTVLHKILIGGLINGEIDLMQSFGVLTSGLFIPLGAVLPYLFSFYLILSLLEDSGYLPRLAVFMDNIMHRLGLHGYAIIPTLLGLGCNVPGVMATRILETKQQRFITATLISIAVPCAALQAMIIGLVGDRGIRPLITIYGSLVIIWFVIGVVLRFTAKGFRPELLIEIPQYRFPSLPTLLSKMWMRTSGFLREALPIITGAILAVNLLYQLELFEHIARFAEPVVTRLWGMPKESIVPLLLGVLRKDVAIGMFAPLELTTKQLIVGSVLLSTLFPCIATFAVLFRELGIKDTLKSAGIMIISVFSVGTVLNLILK